MNYVKYTKDTLLLIAKQHIEQITSTKQWDEYRKNKNLPHSQTFISYFGSWNALKERLGLPIVERGRGQLYDDARLIEFLKQYKDHFTTNLKWDEFALANNLPRYHVFLQRLGQNEIAKHTGKTYGYSDDVLKQLIKSNFPTIPPTVRAWNRLSETNTDIPNAKTIIRRFGSWKKMKYELYRM